MKKLFVFILMTAFLAGCATTGRADEESFKTAVTQNLDAYGQALEAKDLEGGLALHDADVIKMPQDSMPIIGLAALRKNMTQQMAMVDLLKFETASEEFVILGDYGYTRGNYTVEGQLHDTKQALPRFEGKYLTIYKKQADGSWKIYRDSYSSNMTPKK